MLTHLRYESHSTRAETQIFLVDELNKYSTFGITTTNEKIRYNLDLMDSFDIKKEYLEKLKNTLEGLITIFTIGQYIVILKVNKDKTAMTMLFLDHEIPWSDYNQAIDAFGSKNLSRKCRQLKREIEQFGNYIFDRIIIRT